MSVYISRHRRKLAAAVIIGVIFILAGITGSLFFTGRLFSTSAHLDIELGDDSGAGQFIREPSIDIAEVGSGGGSVPKVLQVPESGAVTNTISLGQNSGMSDISILGRSVIYYGRITLDVDDVEYTTHKIHELALKMNGFVSDISIIKGDDSKSGTITIRIPQQSFFQTIELIKQFGSVEYKQVSSQDVTEQQIDLEARLRNARATEERFINLLLLSYSVEDILMVERELSGIRNQIERIQGQLSFLENRVEFSTLTVFMSERSPKPLLPEVDFLESLRIGIQVLIIVIQGLIVLIFALLPIGVIAWIGKYLYQRRQKRKQTI